MVAWRSAVEMYLPRFTNRASTAVSTKSGILKFQKSHHPDKIAIVTRSTVLLLFEFIDVRVFVF